MLDREKLILHVANDIEKTLESLCFFISLRPASGALKIALQSSIARQQSLTQKIVAHIGLSQTEGASKQQDGVQV